MGALFFVFATFDLLPPLPPFPCRFVKRFGPVSGSIRVGPGMCAETDAYIDLYPLSRSPAAHKSRHPSTPSPPNSSSPPPPAPPPARTVDALSLTKVYGPPNNVQYSKAIVESEVFKEGEVLTTTLDTFAYTPRCVIFAM